jgi:hypothetical protein
MHEPLEPATSGHAHDRSEDSRELATLPRDETADLKAGLAKLTLDGAPDQLYAAARIRNYFLAGLVIIGPVVITLYYMALRQRR